jgi:hypothetical protein
VTPIKSVSNPIFNVNQTNQANQHENVHEQAHEQEDGARANATGLKLALPWRTDK